MAYPIYNATKSNFESIEKEIDSSINYINKEIDKLKNDAVNMTKEQFEKAKQKIIKQTNKLVEKIKKKFAKQENNIKSKAEKLNWLKKLIDKLTPDNLTIDNIVSWAKDVIDALKDISEKIGEEVTDITMTSAYITTEIPKITLKLTNLGDLNSKISSLTKAV